MDPSKLIKVLEGTMNPQHGKEAEAQLNEMYKIVGFTPLLLKIAMSDEVAMPIRQAGAIYLKNDCNKYWSPVYDKKGQLAPDSFNIHENDLEFIRHNIVEAIIVAPDTVRSQLVTVIGTLIKNDYPTKCPDLIPMITKHLQTNQPRSWVGSLMILYKLVKAYEFKKVEDKGPVIEPMKFFLPELVQMLRKVSSDQSSDSASLQKLIVKIFYAFIQYYLPLELFNQEMLDQFIGALRTVLEQAVPAEVEQVDETERGDLPCWKLKKWAIRLLTRLFERYGSPGKVDAKYKEFADFILKRYSLAILQVVLHFLDQYRQNVYVAPRVMQISFQYLEHSIPHSHTWKLLKTVYMGIITDVVFRLMTYKDEDEYVWEDNPHEYVRQKFSIYEDYLSPASAACCFLHCACDKRKNIMKMTMTFCYKTLTEIAASPPTEESQRKKDGILQMIGALKRNLLKKKIYRDELEGMLKAHVIPELKSERRYMRARACWVMEMFLETKFRSTETIILVADIFQNLLLHDPELPVKLQAAGAIYELAKRHVVAEKHYVKNIRVITQALLELIKNSEDDGIVIKVQQLICLYSEEVTPFAVEIIENLTATFMKLIDESQENKDSLDLDFMSNRCFVASSVLAAIETVLEVTEEMKEITIKLEAIIAPIIYEVLNKQLIDYYDEIFSLIYSLTCQAISPLMWTVLKLVYEMFADDNKEFFVDMMPFLHNYCTVDTEVLLSTTENIEILFNMCERVLASDEHGDDSHSHAAKLLEVIILQCKGRIDQVIPRFVEIALLRLTKTIRTTELNTMCLQIVIAALYYNPQLLFQTLQNIHLPNSNVSVGDRFFELWFSDIESFAGIHDRKMCIVGFCTLMSLDSRPKCVDDFTVHIVPSLIKVFQGLIEAYKVKGEEEASSSDESYETEEEDDSFIDKQEFDSDEDAIDDEPAEYLEMLNSVSCDLEDDYSGECSGETLMETYSTSFDGDLIDEFVAFKFCLISLETKNPAWYHALTGALTDQQRTALQEIYTFADQRKAVMESRKIENAGGYQFNDTNVPSTFNFSSAPPPSFSP